MALAIPAMTYFEGWVATAIDPLLEELSHAASAYLFHRALQIGGDDFFFAIPLKIRLDYSPECCITELVMQHMQHPATLIIEVPIKKLEAVIVVDVVDDRSPVVIILLQI